MSSTYKVDNIDSSSSFQDGDKNITFNLSNITPGFNRIITVPDNNLTLVGKDLIQTFTNKTINTSNNSIIGIDNNNIKSNAGINATKIANGSISNTEFQYLNGITSSVVGISDTLTLTNKTFTDASTYFQDNGDNTKKMQFELSSIATNNTRVLTVPDANTTIVGTNIIQTLTNKTISASNNTITDLTNSHVGLGNVLNTKVKFDAITAPTKINDSSEDYTVGSRWIDVVNDKEYVCLDNTIDSAIWVETTFTSSDMNLVQVKRTTTYPCTNSYVNLTFNTTDIENNVSGIIHDDINTDRIIIKEDGLYFISCVCNFDALIGSEPYVRIYKNNNTIIGTEYSNSSNNDNSFPFINISIMANFVVDDYITLQLKDIGINKSTLRTDTILSIVRLSGAKGDTGPPGDGENNTASNVGNSGIGIFKQKNGIDLEFKKINNGSNKVLVDIDGNDDNVVNVDIVESNIVIGNLNGAPSGNVVGTSDSQTLTNKTFTDNSTYFQNSGDNSKKFILDLSNISVGTTRTITVPNASTTIVGTDNIQTITNKTIDSTTNVITADKLHSATTTIDISSSVAPSGGELLVASNSTTASWQILTLKYFDAYSTSTTTFSSTYIDVTLDVERHKDNDFTHTSSSSEVTINTTGTYEITFSISVKNDDILDYGHSRGRLVLDTGSGYNEVAGTLCYGYHTQGDSYATLTRSLILSLNSNNKIKIQVNSFSDSTAPILTLISEGSSLTIKKITI